MMEKGQKSFLCIIFLSTNVNCLNILVGYSLTILEEMD